MEHKLTTADRLKQLMRERNLRQVDILEKIQPYCKRYGVKIPHNALSQYISGKVLPKQDKLTILGLALNVSEAWLMGFDVPQDRISVETQNEIDDQLMLGLFHRLNERGREAALAQLEFLNTRSEYHE